MSAHPWEFASGSAELLNLLRGLRSTPPVPAVPGTPSARSASSATSVQSVRRPLATPSAGSASSALDAAIARFTDAHPILPLLESAGLELKKVARTNGGEWAGPCPACGGRDRFCVWPTPRDGSARAWCRQCHRVGDALTWATTLAGRDPTVRGSIAATLRERGYLEERRGRRG